MADETEEINNNQFQGAKTAVERIIDQMRNAKSEAELLYLYRISDELAEFLPANLRKSVQARLTQIVQTKESQLDAALASRTRESEGILKPDKEKIDDLLVLAPVSLELKAAEAILDAMYTDAEQAKSISAINDNIISERLQKGEEGSTLEDDLSFLKKIVDKGVSTASDALKEFTALKNETVEKSDLDTIHKPMSEEDLKSRGEEVKASEVVNEKGMKTSVFRNDKLEVVLSKETIQAADDMPKMRRVDVDVRKGPAIIGLSMNNEEGKRERDSKFVMEFDENGNPTKTVPDLSMMCIDKESNMAYIKDGLSRKYFPVSADYLSVMNEYIKTYNPSTKTVVNPLEPVKEEKYPQEHVPWSEQEIATKSPDKILGEYGKLHVNYINAEALNSVFPTEENAQILASAKSELDLYKDKHTSTSVGISEETIRKNREAMENAIEINKINVLNESKASIMRSVSAMVAAVGHDDPASLAQADENSKIAKSRLSSIGYPQNIIAAEERNAIKDELSKSYEKSFKGSDNSSPVIEMREKALLSNMLVGTGMSRKEVAQAELEEAKSAASKVKDEVPKEQQDQIKLEIDKLEAQNSSIQIKKAAVAVRDKTEKAKSEAVIAPPEVKANSTPYIEKRDTTIEKQGMQLGLNK